MVKKKIVSVEDPSEKVEAELNVKEPETEEQNFCELAGTVATSSNFTYGLEESIVMEDIENRNLYINGEVTPELYQHISYFIMKYNSADIGVPIEKRTPIKLFISTGGGSVWDGLGICEVIKNSLTPVLGICTSYALSMGFYIYISCDERYATSNAFLLNHEGYDGDYGHPSKIKDYLKFSDKLQERLNEIVVKRTHITKKDLEQTVRDEKYIFADEAKDLGVVDFIIGKDCSFDDIL